jgi:hypothetical protein
MFLLSFSLTLSHLFFGKLSPYSDLAMGLFTEESWFDFR